MGPPESPVRGAWGISRAWEKGEARTAKARAAPERAPRSTVSRAWEKGHVMKDNADGLVNGPIAATVCGPRYVVRPSVRKSFQHPRITTQQLRLAAPKGRAPGSPVRGAWEKGCQCLPAVSRRKSLKTHGRSAQRVSRICDAKNASPLPFYPTMFSSRNRRKPMKIRDGDPSYPTMNRGGLSECRAKEPGATFTPYCDRVSGCCGSCG
jgi:hypothetical protein